MKIAKVEGQVWKTVVQTYLVTYQNTTHPSIGMFPSELLLRRKLCTKRPDSREVVKQNKEVRDRERKKRQDQRICRQEAQY